MPVIDLERITNLITKYIEVKSELIKIQVKEHISSILSRIVMMMAFMIMAFLIVIIASFALGFYLNIIFASDYMGFVILSGAYILTFIIAYLLRKSLIRKIIYYVIIEDQFEPENHQSEDE